MDKEKKDIILYNIREFLNENKALKDMNIQCLMIDKGNNKNGIAIASNEEYIVAIDIENYECEYSQEWEYDIDTNIFRHLENGMNIEFITPQFHSLIWKKIESIEFLDYFFHKEGMQKYLEYCKDEEITQEFLEEECDTELTDIMKYSKDYIADNNGIMEMSRTKYQEENEIHYIAFTLGYDLINEMLTKPDTADPLECDIAYDFCDYLARKFIKTDYYKDMKHSTYEMLQDWISDNKEIIQSEYLCYSHKDNKCIIETGKRNSDKVALVEHQFKDGTKEYIIAFNYKVDDKKLDWGYGYYYNNDLKKAKEDFEKVKAGGNLADTFKENKEEERVMEDNSSELQFYDEKEIRNIITNKEELYFADDGIDEVIIKFDDIPDFIVDINRRQGVVNLKFYKMGNDLYQPDITTMGEYLDKVKPEIREKIIDRLVKLQTGEIEPKEYKLIDENEFDDIKIKMEKEMNRKVKNKKNREDR